MMSIHRCMLMASKQSVTFLSPAVGETEMEPVGGMRSRRRDGRRHPGFGGVAGGTGT